MIDHRKLLILASLVILVLLFGLKGYGESKRFHSEAELVYWAGVLDTLPGGYNGLFNGSGGCVQCHGYDEEMIASVDPLGNDINVVDDWRATMMANSAKDPFWRAKVSHESLIYPNLQTEIETKCTSCHAPLGHFGAFHQGMESYTMADLMLDTIGQDGVSCLACHQQSTEGLGDGNSGDLHFEIDRVAYGPFESPLSSPMLAAVDYEPVFSDHISDAGICAGCHTLITQTLDYEGNLTGNDFVEQSTYHEWLNSRYNFDNVSCQNCHLKEISKGQFQLIAGFDTEARDRFYLHDLVGSNTTMLRLMRDNIESLGIFATEEQFDEVIEKTENILKNESVLLKVNALERTIDSAFVMVSLRNLAGHKLPSGYPSRRMFVRFKVSEMESGEIVFESGNFDYEDYELVGQDPTYEPHYDVIRSENEVQIYEMVMADVNEDVTTVLERADTKIKDNRLLPEGFIYDTPIYDTVFVAGQALNDNNFNVDQETSIIGSGTDDLRYNISIPHEFVSHNLLVEVEIYYQALPSKWMKEMFDESTPAIESFRAQFEAADRSPSLMKRDTIHLKGLIIDDVSDKSDDWEVKIMTQSGNLIIQSNEKFLLQAFDVNGNLIKKKMVVNDKSVINMDVNNQIIFLVLASKDKTLSKKIFIQ